MKGYAGHNNRKALTSTYIGRNETITRLKAQRSFELIRHVNLSTPSASARLAPLIDSQS